MPLLTATLTVSFIAMLVALPLGLATAIYLSEYASNRARNTIKPILEVLAGIPTVVYGYFALTFMTPFLRTFFGNNTVHIYNVASAGIVVGILIIPLVASLSEDALHAVPVALRQAAYGLGATKVGNLNQSCCSRCTFWNYCRFCRCYLTSRWGDHDCFDCCWRRS